MMKKVDSSSSSFFLFFFLSLISFMVSVDVKHHFDFCHHQTMPAYC